MLKDKSPVFIFAYYSYLDPVFQSAVLPYFINFPNKEQKFILLTFEQKKYRTNKKQRSEIDKYLLENKIIWYNTNWHSGKFKLIKKIYDFFNAIILSARLILKYKVKVIYSEGFPGAIISHFLSQLFNLPHIVHSFEPHTDYMIDAGVWKNTSWEAKLLKYFENTVAKKCFAIFTATQIMIDRLRADGISCIIEKVPSCVDLEHFKFLPDQRRNVRKQIGVLDHECVIIYLGKFGGMYLDTEVFDFFDNCMRMSKITFKFLIFTPDDHSVIKQFIRDKGLDESFFKIGTLMREEIPAFLSAADFGLVPVRQKPSKRFCSPIKDGEYWACGLPIIIPEGISDDYLYAEEYDIGIVIKNFTENELIKTIKQIENWFIYKDLQEARIKAREFVEKDRDVKCYQELYNQVFIQASN